MLAPEEIKLVSQPNPTACGHAIVAMLTGEAVDAVYDKAAEIFGPEHAGLNATQLARLLFDYGIHYAEHPLPVGMGIMENVFVAVVPSRNEVARLHYVLVTVPDGITPKILDPKEGWDDAKLVTDFHALDIVAVGIPQDFTGTMVADPAEPA